MPEKQLIVLADEIYDKILYDGEHTSIASMADDLLFITFNGLSKNYRAAGFRAGWMVISGAKHRASYIEGLDMLASMRLCANVPSQHAIQTAWAAIKALAIWCSPPGDWDASGIWPGKCSTRFLCQLRKPKSALYLFPKLDPKVFPFEDDEAFALDLLREEGTDCPGHRLQLAGAGSLPRGVPAPGGRSGRFHRGRYLDRVKNKKRL